MQTVKIWYDFWTKPEHIHFARMEFTPEEAHKYAKKFQLTYRPYNKKQKEALDDFFKNLTI